MKIPDSEGNAIITQPKGNSITLYIKLAAENRQRKIGIIDLPSKTLHIKRNRDKHLFRKFNAYGFCYKILSDTKKFDKIYLTDEHESWMIPLSFILDKENSSFLHFKGSGGFELQVFVPLDRMGEFKLS